MGETGNDRPPEGSDTPVGATWPGTDQRGKRQWRAQLTAGRAAISAQQQVAEARVLADTAAELAAQRRGATVCCYVPFGPEPGSIALLDVLRSGGARVLLPVIPATPGPLDWAEYTGSSSLVAGPYRGVLEPSGPRLGTRGVAEAGLVLVPALGVDRAGVRLGRGGGYYDRSLVLASPGTELMAVVRDDELVERLPADPHDVRMTAALTPGHGVVRLGGV